MTAQITLTGTDRDDVAGATRLMLARLDGILAATGSPDDRLQKLDALFRQATLIEKIILREAAFIRLCGVRS